MSTRATYPHFIPLHENILLQIGWALRGLYDSFRINILFSTITRYGLSNFRVKYVTWITFLSYSDAEIRANLLKSLLLNTLSLTSIYTYDVLLHPLVKDQERWLHRNLGRFYQMLWLLPVVGVSFYLNVRITSLQGLDYWLNSSFRCLGVASLLNGRIFCIMGPVPLSSPLEPILISWNNSPHLRIELLWFLHPLWFHMVWRKYLTPAVV
jgi:hypothetical protein